MKLAKTEEFPNNNTVSDIDLPEGWAWSMVGECFFEIKNGTTTVQNEDRQGIPVSRIESIQEGHFDFNRVQHIKDAPAEIIDTYRYKTGDIALSHINSYEHVGKTAIYEGVPEVFIHGMNLLRLRLGHEYLLPKYIYLFMQTYFFNQQVRDRVLHAVNQVSINQRNLSRVPIAIAPPYEQKRIVAKVNELVSQVNLVRQRLAKVPAILKRLRQAVLAAACSGRLTADWRSTQKELEPADQLVEHIRRTYREQYEAECNKAKREGKRLPKKPEILELRKVETADLPEIPDEWTWIYLAALGFMSRGKSKYRPRNAPHLYGGPYPFIQTGDIAQSQGLITSHRQTYSEAGLAQSHLWPAGTICITIAANIANSAILTYPACFPDSVVGLISDETLCLKEYAEFFIRTARANLDQFAPATAQKNINIEILSDVTVPLPPIAEQKEIVRRVEAMFKLADAIEKRVAAATARVEKLTRAILAKAFRGEMVPTEAELARREGRSYESASELLARIKSKRDLESGPVGVNRIRGPRKGMK